jgi:hypothetical protein
MSAQLPSSDAPTAKHRIAVPNAPKPRVDPPAAKSVRSGLYAVLDWLKHAGVSLDPIERALDYWRDLGVMRGLAILILVMTPLVKYVWLPWMASRVVTTVAEVYGLDVEVESWSGALWDLKATGEGVALKARGRHQREELFKSHSVTVDLSFWRWIGRYGWVTSVTFNEPTLYLERSLSKRWNWEDLASVEPSSSLSLHIETLRFDDLHVEWIEHLPAASGGGLVQSTKATLKIGADVLVQDVALPFDSRKAATRFTFNGSTADGVLSVSGAANFFHRAAREADERFQKVGTQKGATDAWAPLVEANVYLENVGTGAIGQILSRRTLMPVTGSMSGNIEFVLTERDLTCKTDLELKNVGYAANPESPLLRGRASALTAAGLADFRANGKVKVGCEGNRAREDYRPLGALQAAVTRAALTNAPPVVQQAALIDERQAAGLAGDAELQSLTEQFARQAGQALAGQLGSEVGAALAGSMAHDGGAQAADGNAVSRGVKGIGRGIKGLFTRDKD